MATPTARQFSVYDSMPINDFIVHLGRDPEGWQVVFVTHRQGEKSAAVVERELLNDTRPLVWCELLTTEDAPARKFAAVFALMASMVKVPRPHPSAFQQLVNTLLQATRGTEQPAIGEARL